MTDTEDTISGSNEGGGCLLALTVRSELTCNLLKFQLELKPFFSKCVSKIETR